MLAGRSGNYARYEIEKKYLLQRLPDELPPDYTEISDTYLPNSSLRLRIVRSRLGEIVSRNLTKKEKVQGKGDSLSLMTSLYLNEDDLLALGEIKGATLSKRRFSFETARSRTSIDVFKESLEGLILAEVEFQNEEDGDAYSPLDPTWKDVTSDPKFSGGSLAFGAHVPVIK